MSDKPVALAEIRNQRLFGPKAAARYLGICEDTLKKISDLGQLRAFNMNGRRAYRLEDLDAYVESLPGWYDSTGEKSAKFVGDRRVS
jgi:Helix-turn-helix domain